MWKNNKKTTQNYVFNKLVTGQHQKIIESIVDFDTRSLKYIFEMIRKENKLTKMDHINEMKTLYCRKRNKKRNKFAVIIIELEQNTVL